MKINTEVWFVNGDFYAKAVLRNDNGTFIGTTNKTRKVRVQ